MGVNRIHMSASLGFTVQRKSQDYHKSYKTTLGYPQNSYETLLNYVFLGWEMS